eukprot:1114244-Prorocentrum_minimum.AAC.2
MKTTLKPTPTYAHHSSDSQSGFIVVGAPVVRGDVRHAGPADADEQRGQPGQHREVDAGPPPTS